MKVERSISTEPEYSEILPAGDSTRIDKYGIRHVQILFMCMSIIALFIARGSMAVAVLAMTDIEKANNTQTEIYNWDKKTQSLVLSSFFWGYVLMQIPAGLLAKKFGGKPMIICALMANGSICIFIPVMAKLGGWQLVCASRLLMGLTQACLMPATHTLLGQWAPKQERTTFAGIVYGSTELGTIIGLPMSGILADSVMGWKLIFYAMGALQVSIAFLYYFFTASTPRQHKWISVEERDYIERGLNKKSDKLVIPWKNILTTPQMWGIGAAHVGFVFSFVVFLVDLPTYLEKGLNISLKSSALLSALPYVGMWVIDVTAGIICDKMSNSQILSLSTCRKIMNSIAHFGGALGLVILSFVGTESKVLAISLLIVTISSSGFCNAGFMCNHLDLSPNFAGVMISLTNSASSFTSIIAPLLTSTVLQNDPTDISRWQIVFLITAGILTISNLIYISLTNTDKQEWDDPNYTDKKTSNEEAIKPVLYENKGEGQRSEDIPGI